MNEKLNYALKNFKISDENNPYNKELISLFRSAIFQKEKNPNMNLNLMKDLLECEENKNKEKNLIDKIINEKIDITRKNLNKDLNSYSYNLYNHKDDYARNINSFDNNNKKVDKGTFITKINIIGKKGVFKEEEKKNRLGKSLNDNFIKNIKDEMVNKGMLIPKPRSSQKRLKLERPSSNNFNNFDFHMKIFKARILKEFKKQIKDYESSQIKLLKNISEELAYKKELTTKQIPIYIKGFKTNEKDVFHSRKLFDVQYQNRYRKPSINLEELIQNHNQYSTYKFKKGKIPFYYFLRTVNNPYQNLKVAKRSSNCGKIFIKFNEKEAKRLYKKNF